MTEALIEAQAPLFRRRRIRLRGLLRRVSDRIRCLLAAGEVYDLMNDHDKARQQYQAVIDAGSESVQADQARKFQRSAYVGH